VSWLLPVAVRVNPSSTTHGCWGMVQLPKAVWAMRLIMGNLCSQVLKCPTTPTAIIKAAASATAAAGQSSTLPQIFATASHTSGLNVM